MGNDMGIVRVDMIFNGHVSKTETEMNILWRNWSIQSGDDLPVSYAAAR